MDYMDIFNNENVPPEVQQLYFDLFHTPTRHKATSLCKCHSISSPVPFPLPWDARRVLVCIAPECLADKTPCRINQHCGIITRRGETNASTLWASVAFSVLQMNPYTSRRERKLSYWGFVLFFSSSLNNSYAHINSCHRFFFISLLWPSLSSLSLYFWLLL